jgi:amidase
MARSRLHRLCRPISLSRTVEMQTFDYSAIKYLYSAEHEPIGSVTPGERFTVLTEDGFTARFRDPENFTPEMVAWVEENLDGVTGPIFVEGARAGQAIEIRIETVEVTTPGCVVISRCESLSPYDWWHEEDHVVNLEIVDGAIEIAPGWSVRMRPLIGCLATAPARETVLSRHEGPYGGNLDCGEITSGATVTLPVEADGALLYFGDCKASMGDGEITAAPEVGTRIVATASPVGRPACMDSPRVRSAERITTIVSGISLADAARTAARQLKLWLEDEWGLSSEQAAIIIGIGADCGIGQVSNLLHTAKCSIDLELLPDAP